MKSRGGRVNARAAWAGAALTCSILAVLAGRGAQPLAAKARANVARTQTLWGRLRPGPHAVGYRAAFHFDRSRVLKPPRDYRGRAVIGDRDRPVLVRVWFPARPALGARRMPYGAYLSVPSPGVPADVVGAWDRRTLDIHRYSAGKYAPRGREGLLERLKTLPTAVTEGAAPAPGRFPAVVYAGGAFNSTEENTVLCEYLASHGYVVAAVPSMGLRSVRSSVDAAGLEAEARDMEFLIAHLHGMESADLDRLAAAGFSFGGAAALVVAMRNPDVDAVVGFDPSFIAKRFAPVIRGSHAFDIERFRVPLLEFHRRDAATVSYELTDSLRYSRRHSFDIAGLDHIDFNSYSLLYGAAQGEGSAAVPGLAAKQTAYEEMARYTLAFLDAYVKGRGLGAAPKAPARWEGYGEGDVEFRYKEALPAPPTGGELLGVIREEGVGRAEQIYGRLRSDDPSASVLAESVINDVGHALLGEGKSEEALRVFGWNVEAHPDSAMAFHGLARAYAKKGDAACAARAYGKALELLADDKTAGDPDKDAVRREATEYLQKAGAAAGVGECTAGAR